MLVICVSTESDQVKCIRQSWINLNSTLRLVFNVAVKRVYVNFFLNSCISVCKLSVALTKVTHERVHKVIYEWLLLGNATPPLVVWLTRAPMCLLAGADGLLFHVLGVVLPLLPPAGLLFPLPCHLPLDRPDATRPVSSSKCWQSHGPGCRCKPSQHYPTESILCRASSTSHKYQHRYILSGSVNVYH